MGDILSTVNRDCDNITTCNDSQATVAAGEACAQGAPAPEGVFLCARKHGCEWYVLRAAYGRVEACADVLREVGEEVYMPMRYTLKVVAGKKKRVKEPLLSNLLFAYSTYSTLDTLLRERAELKHLHFYRNRTGEPDAYTGYHRPLVVSHAEMMNFIRLTGVMSEHLKVVTPEQCHYKSGDMVRIIGGDFAGVVGKVARVAGQQRVVVNLEGLCIVATAYIPTAFIEPLNENTSR